MCAEAIFIDTWTMQNGECKPETILHLLKQIGVAAYKLLKAGYKIAAPG